MFSRKKLVVAAAVVVTATGAPALYRLRGQSTAAVAMRLDRIAAEEPTPLESPTSELYIPVEGDVARLDTLVLVVSAAGQAAPIREAIITAQATGQLTAVPRVENALVSSGALLASIDPAEYQLALKEAQARHRSAEATYREMTLFDERITDAGVRTDRQKAARAKSGLEQAEIAVEKAKLGLERARLRAPFAGRVANVKVQTGQYVRLGDQLMTIIDIRRVNVEVQVLEGQIGFLAAGRRARVRFAAFAKEEFEARVETINPIVDQQTRGAKVVLSVANPNGQILPGMYARVLLDARRFAHRILVPKSAILERDRRKMLFVFEPDEEDATRGLAKWRYVTTGLENESHVEIIEAEGTEMVAPGETVLTAGHQTLVHDARVRITEKSVAERNARPQ